MITPLLITQTEVKIGASPPRNIRGCAAQQANFAGASTNVSTGSKKNVRLQVDVTQRLFERTSPNYFDIKNDTHRYLLTAILRSD